MKKKKKTKSTESIHTDPNLFLVTVSFTRKE